MIKTLVKSDKREKLFAIYFYKVIKADIFESL